MYALYILKEKDANNNWSKFVWNQQIFHIIKEKLRNGTQLTLRTMERNI